MYKEKKLLYLFKLPSLDKTCNRIFKNECMYTIKIKLCNCLKILQKCLMSRKAKVRVFMEGCCFESEFQFYVHFEFKTELKAELKVYCKYYFIRKSILSHFSIEFQSYFQIDSVLFFI